MNMEDRKIQIDNLTYSLIAANGLSDGDCYIAVPDGDGTLCTKGLFDASSGNIYACSESEDPRLAASTLDPVVRIVGDPDGQTGYVTVIQPDGSYRRYSRWDRIDEGSPAQPDAILRTLPQCGCGGSIGMPKLFDSFAELSAYFFCTFAQI